MKATGIVRRVVDLGRIVIPKEIRRTLRIREGDPSLTVGLSMMCYTFGKEKRMCLENFQSSGVIGKLLYCRCLTASCLSKSVKLKNL